MKKKLSFWMFKKSSFISFKSISTLSIIFTVLLIYSCKKDSLSDEAKLSNKTVYDKLIELGFPEQKIKESGDYYVIDDYGFHKTETDTNFLNAVFLRKEQPISLLKKGWGRNVISQARWYDLISTNSSENISVYYDHTATEMSAWSLPLTEAMKQWAEVSDSKINFNLVWYATTWENPIIDITVTDDDGVLSDGTIAMAEWPQNGKPGFRIRINPDFNNDMDVSHSTKLYNMVHELGHCLGLLHTNSSYPAELQISGTPIGDANSVMNGQTALYSWNGFSYYDKVAIQNLYPYQTYDKWITSPEGKFHFDGFYWNNYVFSGDTDGEFTIKWNANLVNTSTVSVELYEKGVYKGLIAQNIPNTGVYNFQGHSTYLPYRSYPSPLRTQVQVKLIADSNPNIYDFSSMFMIKYNE